ncbi:MAG: NUMOD4 motif-containing HNH endonuclease [Mesorhizobium sp.]
MTQRVVKNKGENFYPVPGYEGLYEISLDGSVRSLPRQVQSRGGTRTTGGVAIKTSLRNGYPGFVASSCGRGRAVTIHRCLAILFVPNPENKPHINHIDGDKTNFALSNLEWCTHQENMRHAFRTGLTPFPKSGPGDKSPAARLSWGDVREIRRLAAQGTARQAIADRYGVCKSNINQIVRRETWREVAP